ncbi:hypothetical protein BU23DRAFT_596682 [Bimuria novae-zelandiae CBS 107.79]|uniref:Uncharacterized protein n=1 Tax=Bimuria novae-zelandiae CBS 107.79 TaxID=1447943 RepID=A0A6A5VKW1_9PLEO|nr:hypothetical protein BU23DRAFT_596682 [Bimuria novae-zelandiae CBS 107.79]
MSSSPWPPLQIPWAPPTECISSGFTFPYFPSATGTTIFQDYYLTTTQCYPGPAFPADLHYSPGYCPDPYTTATAWVTTSETRAICCKSGFSFLDGTSSGAPCWSSYTSSTAATVWYLVTTSGSSSTETTTSTVGPGIAAVKGLTVAFRSNDVSLFQSTPTMVPTVTIAATTASITTTNLPSSSPLSPSGLGVGAKAGIGVGAACAVALLAGILVWVLRGRRKQAVMIASADHGNDLPEAMTEAKSGLQVGSLSRDVAHGHLAELGTQTDRAVHELAASRGKAELPGESFH